MASERYVYIQGMEEGIASYHLAENSECWISYVNAPATWLLENGQKPPEKKYFTNQKFDKNNRTFVGTIDWSESPFSGMV